MDVGIYFDLRDPAPWRVGWNTVYGRSIEAAEEAERLGLHSVWLTEHHLFEDGYLPQPLVFAAALAARTRHMRIGTAVLLAPLRAAIEIAEEAAVVDQLSGGRLDLGLGAGYRVPEYEAFGVAPGDRFTLLEDRARAVRALWDEGRVTPTPFQEHVPIWVGAHGPRGAALAGGVGAGLLAISPALWEPYLQAYAAAAHERPAPKASGPWSIVLADDPDRTRTIVEPYAAHQWDVYDAYAREGVAGRQLTVLFERRGMGSPPPTRVVTVDEAVTELRALAAKLPVGEVFVYERIAGMPDDVAARHVELLAEVAAQVAEV